MKKFLLNMWGKNNNEIEKKGSERDYEFIQVNAATGEQFRKVDTLRSESGPITPEMVRNFHDESSKEAQQWRRNNPGKSISFKNVLDENGKQIVQLTHANELIFPAGYRVKLYDENGNQIVGKENIGKEIARREVQWEQWEKNGELQTELQNHQTDDGFVSISFRVAPKRLHSNESGVPENFSDMEVNNKRQKTQNDVSGGEQGEVNNNHLLNGDSGESEDNYSSDSNKYENCSREELIKIITNLRTELKRVKSNQSSRGSVVQNHYENQLKIAENCLKSKLQGETQKNVSPPSLKRNNFLFSPVFLLTFGLSLVGALVVCKRKKKIKTN